MPTLAWYADFNDVHGFDVAVVRKINGCHIMRCFLHDANTVQAKRQSVFLRIRFAFGRQNRKHFAMMKNKQIVFCPWKSLLEIQRHWTNWLAKNHFYYVSLNYYLISHFSRIIGSRDENKCRSLRQMRLTFTALLASKPPACSNTTQIAPLSLRLSDYGNWRVRIRLWTIHWLLAQIRRSLISNTGPDGGHKTSSDTMIQILSIYQL